ncbi:hypothetical protein M0C40_09645 [Spiroplasma citri]|uniref:Plectrovirus-related protein n=1 Tax=Spiroplasma citri TaxID=2133 RepID=A0AAX3SYK2_SPICI|nr:hypothetical protein [Spiroplasma citri]WFG96319.1 hypothetical protein M0C40_09645 [Spiroplasma citri]
MKIINQKPSYNPQQPPKDSDWKNISGTFNQEFNVRNNKWYIISARKTKTTDNYKIIKFKNNDIDKPFGNVWNSGVKIKDIGYYRYIYIVEMVMVNQKHQLLTKTLVKLLTEKNKKELNNSSFLY